MIVIESSDSVNTLKKRTYIEEQREAQRSTETINLARFQNYNKVTDSILSSFIPGRFINRNRTRAIASTSFSQ